MEEDGVTVSGKTNDDEVGTSLYDWDSAAQLLGVTPRLIRELWARHQLSGVKIGRRVRFRHADLVDYIDRHLVTGK
jgi:excisionase family DNA binding protein